MRITKLLSLDSEPAKPILDRAKPIALAFLERIKLPETFVVGAQTIENALGEVRPLEVGDVLVDENGGFYKIEAPVETIFKVTGDLDLMQEAVYALTARGVRVAQTEDGFAVAGIEQYKAMLESVGLTVTAAQEPFTPVPLPRPHHGGCGCGCGGGSRFRLVLLGLAIIVLLVVGISQVFKSGSPEKAGLMCGAKRSSIAVSRDRWT